MARSKASRERALRGHLSSDARARNRADIKEQAEDYAMLVTDLLGVLEGLSVQSVDGVGGGAARAG